MKLLPRYKALLPRKAFFLYFCFAYRMSVVMPSIITHLEKICIFCKDDDCSTMVRGMRMFSYKK